MVRINFSGVDATLGGGKTTSTPNTQNTGGIPNSVHGDGYSSDVASNSVESTIAATKTRNLTLCVLNTNEDAIKSFGFEKVETNDSGVSIYKNNTTGERLVTSQFGGALLVNSDGSSKFLSFSEGVRSIQPGSLGDRMHIMNFDKSGRPTSFQSFLLPPNNDVSIAEQSSNIAITSQMIENAGDPNYVLPNPEVDNNISRQKSDQIWSQHRDESVAFNILQDQAGILIAYKSAAGLPIPN